MLIIEGRTGKLRVLKEILLNNTNKYDQDVKSVGIDYVGVPRIQEIVSHYCEKGFKMTTETLVDDYIQGQESFKNFKTVVFYVDATFEMIEEFKKLDSMFNQRFVFIIQNIDLEFPKVYEI